MQHDHRRPVRNTQRTDGLLPRPLPLPPCRGSTHPGSSRNAHGPWSKPRRARLLPASVTAARAGRCPSAPAAARRSAGCRTRLKFMAAAFPTIAQGSTRRLHLGGRRRPSSVAGRRHGVISWGRACTAISLAGARNAPPLPVGPSRASPRSSAPGSAPRPLLSPPCRGNTRPVTTGNDPLASRRRSPPRSPPPPGPWQGRPRPITALTPRARRATSPPPPPHPARSVPEWPDSPAAAAPAVPARRSIAAAPSRQSAPASRVCFAVLPAVLTLPDRARSFLPASYTPR
jgi:hypothetical protein